MALLLMKTILSLSISWPSNITQKFKKPFLLLRRNGFFIPMGFITNEYPLFIQLLIVKHKNHISSEPVNMLIFVSKNETNT